MTYELEKHFQKDCNDYLESLIKQGILIDYIHLPKMVNAYGRGKMGKNKNSKGKPDLYIFFSGGSVIMIELKIKNKNLEPEQAEYIGKYDKMGYRTYVINDDLEEFKRIVNDNMEKE